MSNAESQSKVWRPPGFDGVELEKIVGFEGKSPLIYVENYEFSLNMSERKSSGYMIYNGHRDSLVDCHTIKIGYNRLSFT